MQRSLRTGLWGYPEANEYAGSHFTQIRPRLERSPAQWLTAGYVVLQIASTCQGAKRHFSPSLAAGKAI